MNTVDLHPEDLLDKEAHGALADHEQAALDEHCAACTACAFERKVRSAAAHFESAASPNRARMEATIAAIVAEPPALRRPRGLLRWANAAALLLAIACSTAAYAAVKRGIERGWFRREADRVVERRSDPPRRRRAAEPGPFPPQEAPMEVALDGSVDTAPRTDAGAPAPSAKRPARDASGGDPASGTTASERLVAAGRARASREYAEARDLYLGLIQASPHTPEALVARVAAGNLFLQNLGRPKDAQKQFAAYLDEAPDGALAEEARIGLARSYAMLGHALEERRAWQSLLEHHPASVHSARAKERIKLLAQ